MYLGAYRIPKAFFTTWAVTLAGSFLDNHRTKKQWTSKKAKTIPKFTVIQWSDVTVVSQQWSRFPFVKISLDNYPISTVAAMYFNTSHQHFFNCLSNCLRNNVFQKWPRFQHLEQCGLVACFIVKLGKVPSPWNVTHIDCLQTFRGYQSYTDT